MTETEIVALSPLRLPVVNKPLAIAYGTAELPPLVSDSRDLHAKRAAAHAPGPLLPVPGPITSLSCMNCAMRMGCSRARCCCWHDGGFQSSGM